MNATFSLKTSFSSNYIWELSRVRPPLEVRQVCCIYSSKQIYLSLVSLFHRSCAVVAIWLVSLTMALPKVTYIDFSGGCTWSVGQNKWLYFLVPAFLVYYVAPLFCITVNCGLIISHLHSCRGSLAADRRNKKATALLIGSTLVFAVSWLPYWVCQCVVPSCYLAAFPISRLGAKLSSTLLHLSAATPGPTQEAQSVSLLWEVASLTAIFLVCLVPCWNPPLYFLLSRPAVRQLRALLPSFLHVQRGKPPAQRWRIAPAPPPPRLPIAQHSAHSLTHQTQTHGVT